MASTMSRPQRSLSRAISEPTEVNRPVRTHRSAGWTTGMRSSWQPMRSISSRTIWTTRECTRQPSGNML